MECVVSEAVGIVTAIGGVAEVNCKVGSKNVS